MTCLLLVLILGMVAFAVDLSWMTLTESELQNAADSAALAGANRLGDNYILFNLPGQSITAKNALTSGAVDSARSTAKTFASYNAAGGVGGLTLLDSDIDVGFTDSQHVFTSYSTGAANYPNTVKVTMRRDASANTPLALFFAPVFGIKSANLRAAAGATLYGGTIDAFKVGTVNSGVLPVTYDVNSWNDFVKTGKDADGNINVDSKGNPLLQVYPSIKATGNFGLLSLDDSHAGANTLSTWISNGMSPADVQALLNNNLIPLSVHNSKLWDWSGDTGFKASNVMDINAQAGKVYVLPLFTPLSVAPVYAAGTGVGSHYSYNIVQFVGVKIMQSPSDNKQVWIQPAAVNDPNMILDPGSIAPIGSNSTAYTSFAGAKLTN